MRVNLPGVIPGGRFEPTDINDHGQVVGEASVAIGLPRSAAWTATCHR